MKLYNRKQMITYTSRVAKINWVIVSGESGPGARPVMQEWVTDIRDQCLRAKVPFFFKQWGGGQKKRSGRI
jgi:protein gp37